MATATLNIELNNSAQYLSVIGTVEQYEDSTTTLSKLSNGISIKINSKDAKSLLSSIGSIVRKLKIVEEVSGIIPDSTQNQRKN